MQHTTADILSIELVHPLDAPELFFRRLSTSLAEAVVLRGAVAFWTIEPSLLGGELANVLAAPRSFLCIDLHLPTSVDQLAALQVAVAESNPEQTPAPHLYLHLRDLEGGTEITSANIGMPAHLLHCKSFLMDRNDGTAEIWIGSHNATRRAILGLNIEATLIVRCTPQSRLYQQTAHMLARIRASCEPFDATLLTYYRWLQGLEAAPGFFEIEGEIVDNLVGTEIKLFGNDAQEGNALRTIGRGVYLAVNDSRSGQQHIYQAEIATASVSKPDIRRLRDSLPDSGERFVYRRGRQLPLLERALTRGTPNPVSQPKYCATIAILEHLPTTVRVYDMPMIRKRWERVNSDDIIDPLLRYEIPLLNVDDDGRTKTQDSYAVQVGKMLKRVHIRHPRRIDIQSLRRPYTRTLDEKRADRDLPLFTRKIVEIVPTEV
jgi:hypothetical protein